MEDGRFINQSKEVPGLKLLEPCTTPSTPIPSIVPDMGSSHLGYSEFNSVDLTSALGL